MFATASAAGVMLSRILAFGFVSSLYRIATVRPRLIGTFTAGFLLLGALSLPLLAAASCGDLPVFFATPCRLSVFAAVVVAEALLWRPAELVHHRQQRPGQIRPRRSMLTIVGDSVAGRRRRAFMSRAGTRVAGLVMSISPPTPHR